MTDLVQDALIQKMRTSQRRKKAALGAAIDRRVEEAMLEIQRLVRLFQSEDPNLGRIILFGSLAKGRPKTLHFDIDLSFEGEEYYRCVAYCLDSPFKVDLIDYHMAAPCIRRAIDREGVIIHAP